MEYIFYLKFDIKRFEKYPFPIERHMSFTDEFYPLCSNFRHYF